MEDAVELFAQKISRSYELGGTDSEASQGWLLKFRECSKRLFSSVKTLIDWIANKIPPWAA